MPSAGDHALKVGRSQVAGATTDLSNAEYQFPERRAASVKVVYEAERVILAWASGSRRRRRHLLSPRWDGDRCDG